VRRREVITLLGSTAVRWRGRPLLASQAPLPAVLRTAEIAFAVDCALR
jgi:hypothetical protein